MTRFRPSVRPLEDRCVPATLVVNTTADDFTADSLLTLREANFLIQNGGNSVAAFGRPLTAGESAQISGGFTAAAGGATDTINFDVSLTGQTITLARNDPFATTVPGTGLAFAASTFLSGLNAPGLVISGAGQRRLFEVFGGTLQVENVTLADGLATDAPAPLVGGVGGAILNNGATVVANYVTFRNNTANGGGANSGVGGAIFNNAGTLTVTNSTFNGNAATGGGGGFGGAIGILDGANTLTNVTVSGNVAAGGGRGLYGITNATGGPGPSLALSNSVFGEADASVSDTEILNVAGPAFAFSGGSNLVRSNSPGVGVALPAGLIVSSADPLLAPLAFNGGPVQTMYPKGGSPVLNAGNNATAANPIDPRGKNRVANGTVDLGAVEVQPAPFAVGVGAGSSQPVRVYNPDGSLKLAITAYAAGYTGGVFVSTAGDFNFDGVADVVTSTGPGGSANIRVFDGADGTLLTSFFGYPEGFTGGVNVAVADFNFDGFVDIICGVGQGGGPNVRVFSGKDNSLLFSQFVYPESFTGGVRVTAADVNNDGYADIICGVGSGGGPNVRVLDGRTGALLNSFFALPSTFTGGLFLAAGDVNGDGLVDIVSGVESGGGPNVRAFNATTLASLSSFFAYDQSQTGGVRVATGDVNGDGYADYITGSGPGSTGQVRVISGRDAATNLLAAFTPFGGLTPDIGGVNVG